VSALLAMDRTTVTAMLKPLKRRGLVAVKSDPADRRGRLLGLTAAGRALLAAALPLWRREHAATVARIGKAEAARLPARLAAIAATEAGSA
jgi:DNA-binding MarR family transcriptional regulator